MTFRSPGLRTAAIPCLVIVVYALLVYCRMLENGFIFLDDFGYIYSNKTLQTGFNAESIRWAFSLVDNGLSYWQPLTLLSLMADYQLFGLDARWYHLENLLIHLSSVVLFFLFIRRLSGSPWRAAAAAAIFALHPLNVESVAWAVERKNVLSLLFALLAVGFYHARHTTGKRSYLYLSLLMQAAGLMAKPMLIILPALLMIVDFWPLNRLQATTFTRLLRSLPALALEKAPYWILSLLSLATSLIYVQHHRSLVVGASWANRVENALVSTAAYLGKLFWPENLAVFYPLRESYPALEVAGALLLIAAITFLAWRLREKHPWLMAGWAWYIVSLLPVLGLMRSKFWPGMADRFSYFAQLGIIMIVVFAVAGIKGGRVCSGVAALLSLCAIITLSLVTARQITYWENSTVLINHGLAVTEDNAIMLRFKAMQDRNAYPPDRLYVKRKLARAYDKQLQGDTAGALADYHKVAELGIDNKVLFHNMALLYKKMNDREKSAYYAEKAAKAKSMSLDLY